LPDCKVVCNVEAIKKARHEFRGKLKNKHPLQKKKRLDHHKTKENWLHQHKMKGARG